MEAQEGRAVAMLLCYWDERNVGKQWSWMNGPCVWPEDFRITGANLNKLPGKQKQRSAPALLMHGDEYANQSAIVRLYLTPKRTRFYAELSSIFCWFLVAMASGRAIEWRTSISIKRKYYWRVDFSS